MCLAVPGKIVNIDRSVEGLTMAKADFGGIIKTICVQWVDVSEGDFILAHAGMAISKINTEEALQTLEDLKQLTVDR